MTKVVDNGAKLDCVYLCNVSLLLITLSALTLLTLWERFSCTSAEGEATRIGWGYEGRWERWRKEVRGFPESKEEVLKVTKVVDNGG